MRNRVFLKLLAAFAIVIAAAVFPFQFSGRLWLGLLASFVVAILISAIAGRLTGHRLHQIVRFADRVASGDLSAHIEKTPADEIGQVAASLDKTALCLERNFAALQTSQRQLETLLNSMEDAVIAVSADDRVLWANQAMDKLVPQHARKNAPLEETVRDPDFLNAVREASEESKVSTARAARSCRAAPST